MTSSAAIRLQIETTLAKRVPAALTLKIKQGPELFATGIADVDAILSGGIPRGSIKEGSLYRGHAGGRDELPEFWKSGKAGDHGAAICSHRRNRDGLQRAWHANYGRKRLALQRDAR